MKNAGEEVHNRIGNRGDLFRLIKLTGKTVEEVKRMNAIDALAILSIDNASQT